MAINWNDSTHCGVQFRQTKRGRHYWVPLDPDGNVIFMPSGFVQGGRQYGFATREQAAVHAKATLTMLGCDYRDFDRTDR